MNKSRAMMIPEFDPFSFPQVIKAVSDRVVLVREFRVLSSLHSLRFSLPFLTVTIRRDHVFRTADIGQHKLQACSGGFAGFDENEFMAM